MSTKKIICYIYDGMADFEISLLLHRLKNTGKREIVTVASSKSVMTAQSGLKFVADYVFSELGDVCGYEALIIPGGPIDNSQNDVCPLVREMIEAGKLVAAICFAPQFLGRAGILKNYRYTTSCSAEKIRSLGVEDPFYRPNYVETRCIKDRNLITAKGFAFVDFAAAVCDYLDIFESQAQREEQMGRICERA